MVYYKAFEKGMICNEKQYKENTDFEEQGAESCCQAGMMHFCENPMDCLNYYPLVDENGDFSEFATVEPLDKVIKGKDKCASKKIHIGAKLGLRGFIEAAVNVLIEKTEPEKMANASKIGSSGYAAKIGSSGRYAKIGSSGDYAQIGSSGYAAQIGSSGDYAQIGSSGDAAKIGSSGYGAQIGSSGDYAKIGSSGDYAQIGSSGYGAQIGSSGYAAKIGSSGRYAQIGSSGDAAKIKCEGDHAVIVCAGKNSMVKAPKGAWITLAEYGDFDGEGYPCICVKSAQIDGTILKPDTWYILKNGEFVEAERE